MAAQIKIQSELNSKILQFLEYLEVERGASPLTLRNYNHYLLRLSKWMASINKNKLVDINQDLVREYRLFLSRVPDGKGGTLSRRTQGYHAIAIRSFLRWLIRNDYKVMSPDKITLPKAGERQVKFLNGGQIDRLLSAPSISTINGIRDKAILEVLFSTGLRVSELTKLDRDKINLVRREFGVIGKGERARVVFLSQRACEWVKKYLQARRDSFKPLFIRHKGRLSPNMSGEEVRLTPRSVQRMVKKYARKVKLPVEVTPHILRHSFATDLLIAGADLRSVQEMLGHKNIATTQIYTHITNRQLREVHEAFHGKGGK